MRMWLLLDSIKQPCKCYFFFNVSLWIITWPRNQTGTFPKMLSNLLKMTKASQITLTPS